MSIDGQGNVSLDEQATSEAITGRSIEVAVPDAASRNGLKDELCAMSCVVCSVVGVSVVAR